MSLGPALMALAALVVADDMVVAGTAATADSAVELPLPIIEASALQPLERVHQAAAYVAALEQQLADVLILLEYARAKREAVRITCLLDKLGPMVGGVQAARALQTRLATLGGADTPVAIALDQQVLPYLSAVVGMRAAAERCVGELAAYVDGAPFQVRVQEPAYFDPTRIAEPVEIEARPPAASPYQLRER